MEQEHFSTDTIPSLTQQDQGETANILPMTHSSAFSQHKCGVFSFLYYTDTDIIFLVVFIPNMVHLYWMSIFLLCLS